MRFIKRLAAAVLAMVMTISVFPLNAFAALEESAQYAAATRTVAAPKANFASGVYEHTINVRLSCSTSGARIFYTLDGSQPTYFSDIYSEAIRVREADGTVIIRAFAVKTGYEDSETVEFTYNVFQPEELEVTYMEIHRNPTKTSYLKGEALSLAGGKISVTYEDGTYENIPMTQSMVSGFNSNTAGEKVVTVSYGGFTDTFTVKVREGYDYDITDAGDEEDVPDLPDEEDTSEAEVEEDIRPQMSGSTLTGWNSIRKELEEQPENAGVTIFLNGAVTVPDTVIRAAAKNDVLLTFMEEEGYKWKLDTSAINKDTIIPYMGLGIRTSAVYIPNLPLNEAQGVQSAMLHINSDNRLGAWLILNVGAENKNGFATLYRYDSTANRLINVDNARVDKNGEVKLVPDTSGDYVVYVDEATSLAGDLDNNLIVNALDAAILMRALVYGKAPDEAKYDVNGDGLVNALDAAEILRRSVM